MNVSNRNVDLTSFFPFSCCDEDFCSHALKLGRCVKYESGEPVLLSGSPAKHCGVILEGQAVAFKFDENGKRYQLCLEEGCFVGIEALRKDSEYNAKIVAATELEVFFLNREGLQQLMDESAVFGDGLRMVNDGRIYQEQWLIPETEITDPVLCSKPSHWISIISPSFVILPVVLFALWACGLMVRRYPVAWLLIFGILAAGVSLLYRQISARLNERLIVTSKNVIHVPRNAEEELTVARLYRLQSLSVEQNPAGYLVDAGHILLQTDERSIRTPLLSAPAQTAELIRNYAEKLTPGRIIPLKAGTKTVKKIQIPHDQSVRASVPDMKAAVKEEALPEFHPIEFHAHWALLVKMILKPLLLLIILTAAAYYLRGNQGTEGLRKILFVGAAAAVAGIIYQFFSWRNHRFSIEEDCVKDYRHRPLARQDQNMAMNHKIQSVRYTKVGFFQNLLNYGTVYILAGEGEVSFEYVGNPKYVQEKIMETCYLYETKRFQDEETRHREYINRLMEEMRRETDG